MKERKTNKYPRPALTDVVEKHSWPLKKGHPSLGSQLLTDLSRCTHLIYRF